MIYLCLFDSGSLPFPEATPVSRSVTPSVPTLSTEDQSTCQGGRDGRGRQSEKFVTENVSFSALGSRVFLRLTCLTDFGEARPTPGTTLR